MTQLFNFFFVVAKTIFKKKRTKDYLSNDKNDHFNLDTFRKWDLSMWSHLILSEK